MFLLFEVLGCKIYFLEAWYKFWLFEVLDSKIYLLRVQTSLDFLKSYTYIKLWLVYISTHPGYIRKNSTNFFACSSWISFLYSLTPSKSQFHHLGLQRVKIGSRPAKSKFYYLGLRKVKISSRPSKSRFHYLGLQKVKIGSRPSKSQFHYLGLQKVKIGSRPSKS